MVWNTLQQALREIRRYVMRSVLTVLGIVIGVAAVITMVTLGDGATAEVAEQISNLGSNLLVVMPGQMRGPGGSSTTSQFFRIADAKAIAREIGSVAAVAPLSNKGLSAIYGGRNRVTMVFGTDGEYHKVRNWPVEAGRQFTESEMRSGKAVCILGKTVQKELFGGQDPMGATIRLEKLSVRVVGILKSKGQNVTGQDQDDTVLVPLHTFQRRIAGNQDVGLIQVSVLDSQSIGKAKKEIELLMRERRNLSRTKEDDFTVLDVQEIAATLSGTTRVLTALLGAVATISLLVGGIGIMNIMLVSVTERTREIGIRLAIGALEREVLLQFLVEAVTLSSLGGLIGIVLAIACSFGLTGILQVPFVFNLGIVVVAFFFSAAVGVVFGYFPARKAAQLDPIDALRHE